MNQNERSSDCQVAVYYFPNWHPTPRSEERYGAGESEWKVLATAQPRFPGHKQPKTPLWGYDDESQPEAMARRIDAAADHGVDVFIYDWYWGEQGPMLHEALENGHLAAANRDRIKFGLMWANHWPVSRPTFEKAVDHAIETYFSHPTYWQIEGRPYFSIYEFHTLIAGLGGVVETRAALDYFRERTRIAGFPGLHLNAVEWGLQRLPDAYKVQRDAFVKVMGVDSVTSYVWGHNDVLPDFPVNPYAAVAARAYAFWDRFAAEFSVPYHPNVTMGWDPWPRVPADQPFEPAAYPRTPLIVGNRPGAFRTALARARAFVARNPPSQRILTVYAWNEWTEGGYLEPDTEYGMAYLEAIQEVFRTA